MRQTIEALAPALAGGSAALPDGVGTPADLLDAVALGIDMFDCVLPTRNGRPRPFASRAGGRSA